MQKFKQDFITDRAIYNKVIQLFGRHQDHGKMLKARNQSLTFVKFYCNKYSLKINSSLKTCNDDQKQNHRLLSMKCLTHLLKTEELKKVLVKVQSQSEDQAVLSQLTKRMVVENNLSQMQQLSRSVQYVQQTTMLLNVQNLMRN